MARIKNEEVFEGYIRVGDPDFRRLSELTKKAQGLNRSLNEFAAACGVNTSTLSRIINQKNSGPSADGVIAQIAWNADPASGVTIDDLLEAHGLAPVKGQAKPAQALLNQYIQSTLDGPTLAIEEAKRDGQEIPRLKSYSNRFAQTMANQSRIAIQNLLIEMGYAVSLDKDATAIVGEEFDCYADFVLKTEALEDEGLNRWAFLMLKENGKKASLSLTHYFGMMFLNNPIKEKTRVSFIVSNKATFVEICEMYQNAEIPASVSVIRIEDQEVAEEFVFNRSDGTLPLRLFHEPLPVDYQELYGVPDDDE